MNSLNTKQVGGDHYSKGSMKCPHCQGELQHWDIAIGFNLNYLMGCATKYLFRLFLKGDDIEQLEKAKTYIDKQITQLKAQQEQTEQNTGAGTGYTNQD